MPSDLVVTSLSKAYEGRPVLVNLNLELKAGDSVAIVGPSGCGKSTLLNILATLEKPDSGTVHLGDVDLLALKGKQLSAYRAMRVGLVFQEHHLLPQLSVAENVSLPVMAAGGPSNHDQVLELLDRLKLGARADQFPASLSGGERQRVAIARALVNSPDLLLCDEPTGQLDAETGRATVDLLLGLSAEKGTSMIFVTHNAEHAQRFGRVLRLTGGSLE